MKRKDWLEFIFLMCLIIGLVCNQIFLHVRLSQNISSCIFFVITLIIICHKGIHSERSQSKKEIAEIMFIYSVSYFLIIYLLGLITGFLRNPLNFNVFAILKGLMPFLVLVVCQEKFRSYAIKDERKEIFVLVTLLLILFNIFYMTLSYDFSNPMDVFEFIGKIIIGTTLNNILLTFTAKHYDSTPGIVYRIITEGYIYIVPIIPNLGPYFYSIFSILVPTIILLRINSITLKKKYVVVKSNKFKKAMVTVPLIIFVTFVMVLISGAFKITVISIASNSMNKTITRGDAVIYEKLYSDELNNIKINDILVFKNSNKIIVHRLTKIIKTSGSNIYITKGDNNTVTDNFKTTDTEIIGRVIQVVPKIGYPSVWLQEAVN